MEEYGGLIFLALPLLLIWMVFSRARRQQRVLATAQAAVAPGLWVMTTSGLHGQVVSAGDEPTVLLEISPGVHTRWARQAIAEVFEEDPALGGPATIVDLTTDDAHGTSVSSPKVTDDPEDPHPDDREDRTHN